MNFRGVIHTYVDQCRVCENFAPWMHAEGPRHAVAGAKIAAAQMAVRVDPQNA